MPFEPLRTDEPRPRNQAKPKDFDSEMLAGCSSFVLVSLLTYFMVIWPHLVFYETFRLATLGLACGLGMGPAAILGAYGTRKFGLAAAGGFVGGALASSIFLFLNLKRILLAENLPDMNRDLPKPEYPQSWQYFVPLAWMLAVIVIAGVFLRKEELALDKD